MKNSIKRISSFITMALFSTIMVGGSLVNAETFKISSESDSRIESKLDAKIDSIVSKAGADSSELASYYATNPNGQVGVNKTIKSFADWTDDCLIAQGAANDDPRVYRGQPMGGAMHEKPVDDYAMYAAWDDQNIYIAWVMSNVSDTVAPDQDYPKTGNGKPTNGDLCQVLAFNIDPKRGGSGACVETDAKTGKVINGSHPWGLRLEWETKVDRIACFHSNNTQKQDIFPLNDNDLFDYDKSVKFNSTKGATTGTRLTWQDGMIGSKHLWGINGYAAGDPPVGRTLGDMCNEDAEWVDFMTRADHSPLQETTYQITIPYEDLGTTKEYVEANGIGVMHMTTFGQSGMDSLPYDLSMNDAAADGYSADPSTTAEKEDTDVITAPLASIGKLRAGSAASDKLKAGKLEVDVAAPQEPGTDITFTASALGGKAPYTYEFSVDGKSVQAASDSETFKWTPTEEGEHTIKVQIKDSEGTKAEKTRKYQIGEGQGNIVTEPDEEPTTTPGDGEEDKTDTDTKPEDSQKAKISKISFDKESPQVTGETIQISALAEGVKDETFKYKFSVEGEDGTVEDLTSGYVSKKTVDWTPLEAGTYKIKVSAKGTESGIVEKEETYKVTKSEENPDDQEKQEDLDVSLKASKQSPQVADTKIRLTANATGGVGDKEYQFLVNGEPISEFSSKAFFDWTPSEAGTYIISVTVKDDNDELQSPETKFVITANNDNTDTDTDTEAPTADKNNLVVPLVFAATIISMYSLRKKSKNK